MKDLFEELKRHNLETVEFHFGYYSVKLAKNGAKIIATNPEELTRVLSGLSTSAEDGE